MFKSQKGFSIVEGLLLVLVLSLIGFAGWYVYETNSEKDSSNTTKSTEEVSPVAYERTTEVPSDWKNFTSEEYGISLSYPDKWSISTDTFDKEVGEEVQNAYSKNATKIFVICYKEQGVEQWCPAQININNQPLSDSMTELREYYDKNATEFTERNMTIDGHEMVEVVVPGSDSYATEKTYYVGANNYTYHLTTVYEGSPENSSVSDKDSLILFEAIRIN